MAEHGWRIAKWERKGGHGIVESPRGGRLPFDASRADADDFLPGELVHVTLEASGTEYRVAHVEPEEPRFTREPTRAVPPLDADLADQIAAELDRHTLCPDYRIREATREWLLVEGDDDGFRYGHVDEIVFSEPTYIELPMSFTCRSFRLASARERAHVGTRVDLTARDAVLSFIDDEDRSFYVTTRTLRWRGPPAP